MNAMFTGCGKKGLELQKQNNQVAGASAVKLKCDQQLYQEDSLEQPNYKENEYANPYLLMGGDKVQIMSSQAAGEDNITYRLYTFENSKWKCTELPWLRSSKFQGKLVKLTEYEEGKWCLIFSQYIYGDDKKVPESCENFMYLYNEEDGSIDDISPEKWFEKDKPDQENSGYISFDQLYVLGDGSIVYYSKSMCEIHLYQPQSGRNDMMYETQQNASLGLYENQLYIYDGASQIDLVDISTQKTVDTIQLQSNSIWGNVVVTDQGELLYVSSEGILFYNVSEKDWEMYVDGAKFSTGSDSKQVIQTMVFGEESKEFYLFLMGSELELIHIYMNSNQPESEQKTLTICSMYNNDIMKDMVTSFQHTNKDVKVDYQVLINDGEYDVHEEAEYQDTLKSMNAELVAGNGADIYVLDQLPAKNMIQKGIFQDLSEIITEPLASKQLLDNIVNPYFNQDGKIYQLPLMFSVPVYLYHSKITLDEPNWSDIMEQFSSFHDVKYSINLEYKDIVKNVIDLYGQEWLKDGCHLNDTVWKESVEQLKQIIDTSEYVEKSDPKDLGKEQCEKCADELFARSFYGLTAPILKNEVLFTIDKEASKEDIFYLAGLREKYEFNYSNINKKFIPCCVIGMNANAQNQEEANAFIQMAISEQQQSRPEREGLPINRESFEKAMTVDPNSEGSLSKTEEDFYYSISMADINQSEVDQFKQLVYSLDEPQMSDHEMQRMLYEYTLKALTEQYNLDDLVNEFENKLALSLAE